jgi:hypothetical protein
MDYSVLITEFEKGIYCPTSSLSKEKMTSPSMGPEMLLREEK